MVARQLAHRDQFRIVGAIDVDPAKVGRDVGELAGLGRPIRVKVSPDSRTTLKKSKPDVVVLCTSSSIKSVLPQLEDVLKAKLPVVTTTEELSYPVKKHTTLARKIDAMAKKAKVAVLATGVNPGFVMDALPIALTAVSERVESIAINRVQDARTRRLPFQQKIGAGLTRDQFDREVTRGSIRHVGLAESISMIADALGWKIDRITDQIKPKIADRTVESEFLAVDPGYVSGIIQDGAGYKNGTPVIKLHMEAYLGAPESFDSAVIEGVPRLEMKIVGGVPGDIATTSIVINSIPKVLAAKPGLQTMRHLPLPSYCGDPE
jgi:4-hydroxy-tetrahydrodipicolinate reductase